ncbi:MAG: ammonium transporter [Planctomycetes bacterium]|nr:ammonium transporter [Planctomycetota bacterium]
MNSGSARPDVPQQRAGSVPRVQELLWCPRFRAGWSAVPSRLFCLGAFVLACGLLMPLAARAQDGRSNENQVERMMGSVRGTEAQDLVGLRRYASTSFDAGQMALKSLGICGALLLLTPGLALFYLGMSPSAGKPVLALRVLAGAGVLSLAWVLWIYSLAFTRNEHSFDVDQREILAASPEFQKGNPYLGGLDHLGLRGLDSKLEGELPAYPVRRVGDSVPQLLILLLELALLITAATPLALCLPAGWRVAGVAIFCVLWGTVVYAPVVYWTWGGGWQAAALDSTGGLVIHLTVGCSVLGAALALRSPVTSSAPSTAEPPRLPWLLVGTALIWGGALLVSAAHVSEDSGIVANALLATHLAACTGILGWTAGDWLKTGSARPEGACCGALAGIASIAAGCGVVPAQSAMIIGLVCSVFSQWAYRRMRPMDAAGVYTLPFAVQAVPGGLGVLLTGCFAASSVGGYNRHGDEIGGLLTGNLDQIVTQALALVSVAGLSLAATFVLAKGAQSVLRRQSAVAAEGPAS